MKFLFDLLPVILFFGTYKIAGLDSTGAHAFATQWLGDGISTTQAPILIATAVTILATVGQILWVRIRHGKVDTMLWVSLAIVSVFGGATLFFHDATFIKWKPTVLYWLFASILGGATLFGQNPVRRMMEAQLTLPDSVWKRLNAAWAMFFAIMGFVNLYVAYNFTEEAWVNFKLFGGMGLMFAFVIAQSFYLSKYMQEDQH